MAIYQIYRVWSFYLLDTTDCGFVYLNCQLSYQMGGGQAWSCYEGMEIVPKYLLVSCSPRYIVDCVDIEDRTFSKIAAPMFVLYR